MKPEKLSTPLISVVIPNLNGINYLPGCLSSIREQTFKEFEVIVVDNG
ncbi:MAG: glycosyltransferase family 2 protein, partial [Promethearchaeota archaeon]